MFGGVCFQHVRSSATQHATAFNLISSTVEHYPQVLYAITETYYRMTNSCSMYVYSCTGKEWQTTASLKHQLRLARATSPRPRKCFQKAQSKATPGTWPGGATVRNSESDRPPFSRSRIPRLERPRKPYHGNFHIQEISVISHCSPVLNRTDLTAMDTPTCDDLPGAMLGVVDASICEVCFRVYRKRRTPTRTCPAEMRGLTLLPVVGKLIAALVYMLLRRTDSKTGHATPLWS